MLSNQENLKLCGGCAYMLYFNDVAPVGYCYYDKNNKKHPEVCAGQDACEKWLDHRVRYSSRLKEITDKNTLNWLHKVINEAYLRRYGGTNE